MVKLKTSDCWKNFPRSTPRSTKPEVWSLEKIKGGAYVYAAPDGSLIRKFQDVRYAGLCHAIFPANYISKTQKHVTVDEIWYCIKGKGKIWTKKGSFSKTFNVKPDDGFSLPVNAHFQVRNDEKTPLIFIISTTPPWPGANEATRVKDHWKVKD